MDDICWLDLLSVNSRAGQRFDEGLQACASGCGSCCSGGGSSSQQFNTKPKPNPSTLTLGESTFQAPNVPQHSSMSRPNPPAPNPTLVDIWNVPNDPPAPNPTLVDIWNAPPSQSNEAVEVGPRPSSAGATGRPPTTTTAQYSTQEQNEEANIIAELPAKQEEGACSAEVKQCSNGQYVGRAPQLNCNFYPCPAEGWGEGVGEGDINDVYLFGKLRSSYYCGSQWVGWSAQKCSMAIPCPSGRSEECPVGQK